MRVGRTFPKEHRSVLYNNLLTSGNLFKHLAEIGQACKERTDRICTVMAKQKADASGHRERQIDIFQDLMGILPVSLLNDLYNEEMA